MLHVDMFPVLDGLDSQLWPSVISGSLLYIAFNLLYGQGRYQKTNFLRIQLSFEIRRFWETSPKHL